MFDESDDEFGNEFVGNLPNKPRVFQHREDFLLTLDEVSFIRRFRVNKQGFLSLLSEIEDELASKTRRNNAMSPKTMLFAFLRFVATGTFLLSMGDFIGISESAMSKVVLRVATEIAKLLPKYVHFPRTMSERRETFEDFYQIAGFPRVVGAIDGTHVKIQSPGGPDAELFRNRKQYFSINVQSVSGPHLEFYDIVVNWPGSTHDSHIFNNSTLKQRLENDEFDDAVIVADGGYAVQKYMMTPYRQPVTNQEKNFNKVQAKTRNVVERKYGVWKRRFPCLALGMRLKLSTILTVISACAVLQNFCVMFGVPEPEPDDPEVEADINLATTMSSNLAHGPTNSRQSHGRFRRDAIASQLYNSRPLTDD